MTPCADTVPRVAYLTTPTSFGGAERVNLNFLRNVDRSAFEIRPLLFVRPWEGENLFAAEAALLGYRPLMIPVARKKGGDALRLVRCIWQLLTHLCRETYHLIHTHGYLADLMGLAASRLLGIPIVSTCHGFIYGGRKLSFYYDLDCRALRFFTRVIPVSGAIGRFLEQKGVHRHRIEVIENTLHPSDPRQIPLNARATLRRELGVASCELLVGYFGRLSEEKGISFLLEAVRRLSADGLALRLLIIGDGPLRSLLEEQASQHGLAGRVMFKGFQKEIDAWFTALDLFVLPSLTEGTPMVLLEAMQHGVPCIASAVGGVPDMISTGVDGILVRPGDTAGIAGAISGLCADTARREQISANARNGVSRHNDIETWTRKIEGVYKSALTQR